MKIPVSKPDISDLEKSYVSKAMADSAISGLYGEYLELFNSEFASFCGTNFSENCSSGTSAIHLSLLAVGIKKGDEVLVSTLTNMATFFAVIYCGGIPIPVDIDPKLYTMCPIDLEKKITKKSKAILVVHLFGQPTEMDLVMQVANSYKLPIIEDCAEAHGAVYKGKKVGSIGDISAFSFFGNKILACGEGGAVTTNNPEYMDKVKSLKSLAFGALDQKFMHTDIGYNYRMTNLQASIAYAQTMRAEKLINKRIKICEYYQDGLKEFDNNYLLLPVKRHEIKNVYWMYHLNLINNKTCSREKLFTSLNNRGIELRPGFVPANLQKIFKPFNIFNPKDCPNANKVAFSTFYLPTFTQISQLEQDYVIDAIKSELKINLNE